MAVVQTDGRDRALLCLPRRDRTARTGGFAAARIVAGKTRTLIGWDLEDGDNRLVGVANIGGRRVRWRFLVRTGRRCFGTERGPAV
jgi:hypothetical protein